MVQFKRLLCLTLCCVLVLGVTIGSVCAADFPDSDRIVHTQAVDMITRLSIMSTEEDGSFDPEGTITRAEMCRIICLMLNGGKDPALNTTFSQFNDVETHFAEGYAGYIEYCANLGVVSGRGDGSFDPDTPVTGIECAKMMLIALGYDSTMECFTGTGWADPVNRRIEEKDLYAGLEDFDPWAAFRRDDAAQMLYNTIHAVRVEYTYEIISISPGGKIEAQAIVKDDKNGSTILFRVFHIEN